MSEFIWVISAGRDSLFGLHGVSESYILPVGEASIQPKLLSGKRLWIVSRKDTDRIILTILVKKVEKIIEGYYEGDYLLSVDLSASFRLASSYLEAINYLIKIDFDMDFGLKAIDDLVSRELYQTVKKSIHVSFNTPDPKLLSRVKFDIFPKDIHLLAKLIISNLTTNLNLNEIWAPPLGQKIGPFANLALTLVEGRFPYIDKQLLVNEFERLDPVANLAVPRNNENNCLVGELNIESKVDINFNKIDPQKIYARKFLSIDPRFENFEDALSKTEHAEFFHQEMLRDIAGHLLSLAVLPYESSSVDLFFQLGEVGNVVEIKSATETNIVAQAAKGMFQLVCYLHALENSYNNLTSILILQKTKNLQQEKYLVDIFQRVGIRVLYYDISKKWPLRVDGLLGDPLTQ